MAMFCSDVFPKGVDTPQLGFPRHRNAKPCVFQIGIKIQQIRSLGKEQELMLWIFTDLCKYLVSPFRLPSGEIAHAGKKKVLRTFLFHPLELARKELRISEVIYHMIPLYIIPCITVGTAHCTADDQIHVLNLIFDTNTHDSCHSSRFFLMRSRHSSNRVISSSEKPL